LLHDFESRNVTFVAPGGGWPIVWRRARGARVWDVEGREYVDLTAAFGVAAAGHANPRVVRAAQRQMRRLLHAMGDVHPHELKGRLARELSRITFERWTRAARRRPGAKSRRQKGRATGKTIFGNSGFEAVEAALKTAFLATGRPGVIAFEGAYHGLGYGALNATHRELFRAPFKSQLGGFGHFVPFPQSGRELGAVLRRVRALLRRHRIGAILVEPVQGRGGIRVPTARLLPSLRRLCDGHAALLVVDEVFTGFGRTGKWFGCEHSGTVPDLICLGKALTGGFPLSACVGRAELMDAAWPRSAGEALHTSTYLGHPVGCAMALAQIAEIRARRLVERSLRLGRFLLEALRGCRPGRWKLVARGLGLMVGLELRWRDDRPAGRAIQRLLQRMLNRGYILLPEGEAGEVLSFTPPLTIGRGQLRGAVEVLAEELQNATGA
jgi:4-aminobutyrate aminotransferase-like enzyme